MYVKEEFDKKVVDKVNYRKRTLGKLSNSLLFNDI